MASLISMMLSDWSFWRWMNLNWRWPAAVGDFTLRFIASSRSLTLKPNTCFSALGGMVFRTTTALS